MEKAVWNLDKVRTCQVYLESSQEMNLEEASRRIERLEEDLSRLTDQTLKIANEAVALTGAVQKIADYLLELKAKRNQN
jgi:uncharacterized protein (UPF0335 family)